MNDDDTDKTLAPVSYTHLDVYKRQAKNLEFEKAARLRDIIFELKAEAFSVVKKVTASQ